MGISEKYDSFFSLSQQQQHIESIKPSQIGTSSPLPLPSQKESMSLNSTPKTQDINIDYNNKFLSLRKKAIWLEEYIKNDPNFSNKYYLGMGTVIERIRWTIFFIESGNGKYDWLIPQLKEYESYINEHVNINIKNVK
jgi:hypothetical protein